VPRALVAGRVDDLGAQVVVGLGQRLGQARIGRDERQDLLGEHPVAAEQVLHPLLVEPGAPGQQVPLVPQGRPADGSHERHVGGDRGPDRAVQALHGGVDGVGSHHAVGRVLAASTTTRPGAGEATVCSRESLEVLSDSPDSSGRSPAYTPSTSSRVSGVSSTSFTWASR
jgi:hypothetical protein